MKQLSILAFFLSGISCLAQSNISSADRYAYSANAGWIDFRANATDGVVVTETYLSGKAYAANFGWIDFGDGSPDNGYSYSNASQTDYGVNIDETGALSGYAYSANIGWIQFEQVQGKPTLYFSSGQFDGYAYSANVGWIALDTNNSNLLAASINCPDLDGDGIGDSYEMLHLGALNKIDATSDYDYDGYSDASEYLANTSPVDATDFLKIISQSFNAPYTRVTIHFTSKTNRVYRIEHNTDLGPVWEDSNLGTFPPDVGNSTLSKSVKFDAGPRRFFRVVAQKPLQP